MNETLGDAPAEGQDGEFSQQKGKASSLDGGSEAPIRLSEEFLAVRESRHKRRWVVLAIFSFTNTLAWLNGILYAPLAMAYIPMWGVTVNEFNAIGMVSLLVPMLFTFFAMAYADSHRMEASFYFSNFFHILASWIRVALPIHGRVGYMVALITGAVMSGTHPWMMVLPPRLSADYFPAKERHFATAVGAMGGILGGGLGMIISPQFGKHGLFFELYLFQAIAGTVPVIISFFFFDVKNMFKPRVTYDDAPVQSRENLFQTMKRVLLDLDFVKLLVTAAFSIGSCQTYISLIGVNGRFLTADNMSVSAALFFGAGFFGGIVMGKIADRFQDSLKVGRSLLLGTYPCVVVLMLGWYYELVYIMYIGWTLLGFCYCGLFPLLVEAGIELTFKFGTNAEGTICGILHLFGNAAGAFFIYLSTPKNVFASAKVIPLFWIGLFIIPTLLYFLIPKRYLRKEHEARVAAQSVALEFQEIL